MAECPKCGIEVDDNATTCPGCKKVLKMSCPICRMLNDSSTCKKCGYVILTKCSKCGKAAQTATKTCKSCGADLEKSVIQNEANGEDFAMLTVEFPNMNDIKTIMGTGDKATEAFNKFKTGVDKMLKGFADNLEIRRQIIDKVYIFRFVKDYTFNSSTETATNSLIMLANKLAGMNLKLLQKKGGVLKCNMTVQKRNIEDDPNNYKSGLNINLMSPETKSDKEKVLSGFQVISDPKIMELLEKNYKFEPLNSVMVNGEMMMFYEMDIKPFIDLVVETDDGGDGSYVPQFVENMLAEQDKIDGMALNRMAVPIDPDAIYEIEPMKLPGIQSDFLRTENVDVFYHIVNRLQAMPKGILAIKTSEIHKPYSLKIISTVQGMGVYNNIVIITCYDEMKYSPYSFFRELTAAVFEYTVSQKLFANNNFSGFSKVDPEGLIKDLIMLKQRDVENPQDTRYVYFDLFLTMLQAIPKTLIFIDNFDKIDESSYDVLKYLFEAFDNLDISYLISHDKNFSLHKDCHFLITQDYYSEINLKPTPWEKMLEEHKEYFANIIDNFYLKRIEKYAHGSVLFLDVAIQYLVESEVFHDNGETIEAVSNKTVMIPSTLEKLMKRRLDLLQDDDAAMRFLASILLMGVRIDMETVQSLGFENTQDIIDKLTKMGYIYTYNNALYFPNYNLLRDCMLESVNKEFLGSVADNLFEQVMDPSMPSPTKAYLYGLLDKHDEERREWEMLAQVNLSMGDFSAYMNCTDKILEILNKETDPELVQANEEYKTELYENIAINLYEYVPDKSAGIAEETLKKLEQSTDTEKVIVLCNKMIQGCLVQGDYNQALQLSHKVLSVLPPSSLDPKAPNFNHYYFLMSLVHIQILFNIGHLKECLDMGFAVLNVVNDANLATLKPDYFEMESFKETLYDAIGYVALANALLLTGTVAEFLKLVRTGFTTVPQSYDIFVTLEQFLQGKNPQIPDVSDSKDKFSNILVHVMRAFAGVKDAAPAEDGAPGPYTAFADEIYKAKILAKKFMLHKIEMMCDLFIGYAYLKNGSTEKARDIFSKLVKATNANGMTMVLYVAWFLTSELYLSQRKYDPAFGILKNVLIQVERNSSISEYIQMLFKYNMFKVLCHKGQVEQAEICISQAKYLAEKHSVTFAFDDDPSHYEYVAPAHVETEQPASDGAESSAAPAEAEPPAEQEPVSAPEQ